jgi:tRNA/rRNA methyltransferase
MGFTELWLVDPCPLEPEAYWVAHHSDDILRNARTFPNLASALAEVDFSIASGARRRLEKDDYLSPSECRAAILGKRTSLGRSAIVFGRESSGLTGDEMALCDAATSVPLAHEQPSLNLAQAVMLYAWELNQVSNSTKSPQQRSPNNGAADASAPGTFQSAKQQLNETLNSLNVHTDENLHQWAREALARCDSRDLGMLMTLMRRIMQHQPHHSPSHSSQNQD